jgi:hypothetical protein
MNTVTKKNCQTKITISENVLRLKDGLFEIILIFPIGAYRKRTFLFVGIRWSEIMRAVTRFINFVDLSEEPILLRPGHNVIAPAFKGTIRKY